jgi:formiminotetrahydrofolate cyclodeaminase
MLSSLSITDFAAKLASDEVPPGGGSTAAIYGLMAASLLEMAITYSQKTPKSSENSEILIAKQADLARLHIELTILIERDALALRGLLAAAGMPDNGLEQQKARNVALQKTLKQAAEVPIETARACLEVMEIGKGIVGIVDKIVVSDLMAGVVAAHAGITASLLSTAINLGEIQDETLVSGLTGQIYLLRTTGDELKAALEEMVYSKAPFTVLRG